MQLTKQQQQQFAQRMNDELNKMTMSWDNVLNEWYPVAIKALDFTRVTELRIPQNKMIELFDTNIHGVNMNVVMALCNNLEARSANEMGVSAKRWADILLTNHAVATRWQELVAPVNKQVTKEFEIMAAKPQLVVASGGNA